MITSVLTWTGAVLSLAVLVLMVLPVIVDGSPRRSKAAA
ncbi:hypothetical protein JOF53_005258 [Crossiella equi]|uniref:Uncharacterized protein n=1 Tax=Crossiella equi TaxID=130796 RepID=A0ABS5AIL1_9PSEU|nr:hypothetical protein [Crossiella equi]